LGLDAESAIDVCGDEVVRNIKQILAPKHVVLFAVVLVLGWFMATVISTFIGNSSGSTNHLMHYFDVESRLNSSDAVVKVEYIDEEEYSRPIILPVTNEVVGQNYGVFREYKILESFMGDFEAGETIYVASSYELLVSRPQVDANDKPRVVFPITGETYVLFLYSSLTRETDPPKIGDTRWSRRGQPTIAQLIEDKLWFMADSTYVDAVEARNEQPGVPGSAAPFTMTLEELRELKNRPVPVDIAATKFPDGE